MCVFRYLWTRYAHIYFDPIQSDPKFLYVVMSNFLKKNILLKDVHPFTKIYFPIKLGSCSLQRDSPTLPKLLSLFYQLFQSLSSPTLTITTYSPSNAHSKSKIQVPAAAETSGNPQVLAPPQLPAPSSSPNIATHKRLHTYQRCKSYN